MDDIRERIGLNLQNLRRARGMTQEELASNASVNQTYVSDIERGIRNPSVQVLARIATALEADIEDLVRRRSL